MVPYSEPSILVPRFCEENGFYTTSQRSKIMSRIKSKNTKPEVRLRKALWALGLRYRLNVKKLPGKPDIVLAKYKLALFIDGEFWHGYQWPDRKTKLKSNRDFWIPKIERNMQRDREINIQLIEKGWHVMRFWDHEVERELGPCINQIMNYVAQCEGD